MYATPAPQDDYSGVVLCLVIFLMLMLIFRGTQYRRNCVIYLQDDEEIEVAEVSYAEVPPVDTATQDGQPPELGNPTTAGMFSPY